MLPLLMLSFYLLSKSSKKFFPVRFIYQNCVRSSLLDTGFMQWNRIILWRHCGSMCVSGTYVLPRYKMCGDIFHGGNDLRFELYNYWAMNCKYIEGNGSDLIFSNIQAFSRGTEENRYRVTGLRTKIWTQNCRNMEQECRVVSSHSRMPGYCGV